MYNGFLTIVFYIYPLLFPPSLAPTLLEHRSFSHRDKCIFTLRRLLLSWRKPKGWPSNYFRCPPYYFRYGHPIILDVREPVHTGFPINIARFSRLKIFLIYSVMKRKVKRIEIARDDEEGKIKGNIDSKYFSKRSSVLENPV